MKISTKDFHALRSDILFVVATRPDAWREYERKGIAHIRYRWDVLKASGHPMFNLYCYLNEADIDTALKAILGEEFDLVSV